MKLQESGEMYLETILVLSKEKSFVRAIDVGEHMGYSKPSVSRAIGLLRNGGLVEVGDGGDNSATLVDGRVGEIAKSILIFGKRFPNISIDFAFNFLSGQLGENLFARVIEGVEVRRVDADVEERVKESSTINRVRWSVLINERKIRVGLRRF